MSCVSKVSKKVKPRKGQTKKSSAYGIYVKQTGLKPHKRKK